MILEIIFIERKELKIKEELIKILVLVVFVFLLFENLYLDKMYGM